MALAVKIIVGLGVAAAAGVAAFFFMRNNPTANQVCFNSNTTCFWVEIANDEASRQKGLMEQASMEQNKGMLFIFDAPSQHSFWMKNTLIPLDIIWIDEHKKVVFVYENAKPCLPAETECPSIQPTVNAQYVLEINAGMARQKGIKTGDRAQF